MNNLKTKEGVIRTEERRSTFFSEIRNSLGRKSPLFRKNYTYISAGITIQGDVIAKERVIIDGSMYGNIRATGHISLGSSAHFEGSIECESALVSGYVKGRIQAKKLLVVKTPATIIGDLVSASVQLESGVVFHGKIISNPKENLLLCESAPEAPESPAVHSANEQSE